MTNPELGTKQVLEIDHSDFERGWSVEKHRTIAGPLWLLALNIGVGALMVVAGLQLAYIGEPVSVVGLLGGALFLKWARDSVRRVSSTVSKTSKVQKTVCAECGQEVDDDA